MDLRYVNSKGVELNLTQWPYMYSSGDIYDFMWGYDLTAGNTNQITGFYRVPLEIPIKISVTADTKEAYIYAVNHLFETTEVDILSMIPGKLYIGNQYMKCYIRGIKKAKFNAGIDFMFSELNIIVENPFWITESTKSFTTAGSTKSGYEFLDYPYDYDYDYAPDFYPPEIINIDHYADCKFLLKIYGPAIEPSVIINGIERKVYVTLEEDQYLLIDARDKTVKRIPIDGTALDAFDNRKKAGKSIFTQMVPGLNTITWNHNFGFDLTIFKERSEPEWR